MNYFPLISPSNLNYPSDWKSMYGTRGYLVTMHVPSDFASKKNNLLREIRRFKGSTNVKQPWTFLDRVEKYGATNLEILSDENS
jgi:hypothetical protein